MKIAFKYSSACTKIVRSEKIQRFLENCDHAADTYWSMKIFDQHPTVKHIKDVLYVYRRNNTSVTKNGRYKEDTKLFYSKLIDLLKILKDETVKTAVLKRIAMFTENKIDY